MCGPTLSRKVKVFETSGHNLSARLQCGNRHRTSAVVFGYGGGLFTTSFITWVETDVIRLHSGVKLAIHLLF